MSNLLPPKSQKKMRAQYRARFLLECALVMLGCAFLFVVALAPAEAALLSITPPGAQQSGQANSTENSDSAALAQTKALLGDIAPLNATTSLDSVVAALSEAGQGVTINDIKYSVANGSITLAGRAQTPDEVNTFREALESDLRFTNVSVPVSALLGSEDGTFTITMNIAP